MSDIADEAERMYALRDELDVDAQRLEAGARAATESVGEDASRTIEIRLEGDLPVVTVRDGWQRHHEPAALGSAVLSVLAEIGVRRFQQSQEAAQDATFRPRPIPPRGSTPGGIAQDAADARGDQLDPLAMLRRLTDMVDTIAAGMDETVRTVVSRGTVAREGESVPGHVTASVQGSNLSGLTYDEDWLATAGPSEISRETNEAIAAAVRRAEAETPVDPLEGTPLSGFSSIMSDPAALSRYLFGDEDFTAPRTEGR